MRLRPVRLFLLFGTAALLSVNGAAGGDAAPVDPAAVTVGTVPLSETLPSRGRLGGVAIDPGGNIYVSNFGRTAWKITPEGRVTALTDTLRGSSGNAVMPDGSLLQASFLDNRIVRIDPAGDVHEFASGFDGPVGIAVAADAAAYVCNCRGNSISRVKNDGSVSVFAAGTPLDCPNGIVIDPDGDLIVASYNSNLLARVDPDGSVKPWIEVPGTGNAHLARVADDLFVTKIADNVIYRIGPDGGVSRIAGTGERGFDDGPGTEATLSRPNGIAATPAGDALIVNTLDGVWKKDAPGRLVLRKISLHPARPGDGASHPLQPEGGRGGISGSAASRTGR